MRNTTHIEVLVFDDFSVMVSVDVGQTGKGIDTPEDSHGGIIYFFRDRRKEIGT